MFLSFHEQTPLGMEVEGSPRGALWWLQDWQEDLHSLS